MQGRLHRSFVHALLGLLGCAHAEAAALKPPQAAADTAVVAQPSRAAVAPADSALQPAAKPALGQVVVELAGLHSDAGQVLGALFRTPAGFPSEVERAFARNAGPIHAQRASLVFGRVPPGPFAVIVHHDENGNRHMETGMFGMPLEGYATSRDVKATFGPPTFEAAQLTLAAGERKQIVVHLVY